MASSTADVRQFLTDYFSDEELTTLCFDFFPEVYDSFASGMSKGQKIQLLMEFSRRREQLIELLKILQQQRPVQFAKRLERAGSTTPVASSSAQRPSVDAPASSPSSVSGGVNVDANNVTVGNDVVGRDKLIQAGTYIEHATIIQSDTPVQEIKPTVPTSTDNRHVIGGIEFVRVPAGKFIMGSTGGSILAYDNQHPQHTVEIPYDYWIGKYPVTNEQYARAATGAKYKFALDSDWQKKPDHPVINVTWYDAMAYCRWLNDVVSSELEGLILRLPTEAEWEMAARGTQGNMWPWGDKFDKRMCNSSESGKRGTTPVGAYSPHGDSPYGVADMAGNVNEWCHSLHKAYPYRANDGRESESDPEKRVLRGGSWEVDFHYTLCAWRGMRALGDFHNGLGFRVVVAPPLPG